MPNLKADQNNGVITKTPLKLDDVFTSANVLKVSEYGRPDKTYKPGYALNTLLGNVLLPKGTPLTIYVLGGDRDEPSLFLPDGTENQTTGAVPLTWGQLHVATDSGNGTLSKAPDAVTGTAENAGGTAVGKLVKANGNYVEYTITNPLADTTGVVLALAPNNNASYVFGTDTVLSGTYVYAPDSILKWFTGTGTTDGTAQSSVAPGSVARFEIANTNDVLLKYNGTTVHTFAGVLVGVTDIWIKAMFVGTNAAGDTTVRKVLTAKGLGVA